MEKEYKCGLCRGILGKDFYSMENDLCGRCREPLEHKLPLLLLLFILVCAIVGGK